jgi:hypothetical protein
MIRKYALAASASLALLAGCGGGSGDININPSTTDNSVNDSNNTVEGGGNTDTNPCASYVTGSGQTRQGSFDAPDCVYDTTFVDAGNNLAVDLDIPALADGGAHIFRGSLFVGESHNSDAELQAAGIAEGGDGPTLTIEAGATLAWQSNANFLTVNRGSRIIAVGTPSDPITLTSVSDISGDLAEDPEAVQQWGGVVIDGFGVTNKCSYTGTRGEADFALDGECHVASEGSAGLDENFYGGANDDDSSGRLEYLIVKHTGATVGNGDELNGITFSGVGRNTVARNIQTYSTFDDGIEMFGGAVSFENYVGVYVRDDSIDIDEGWIGSIDTALVIQSETDGNHCIEADGIGSYDDLDQATRADFVARGLNSRPTINNLTCIISPNGADTATHDPGAGWRLREGIWPTISDSMVIGSFGPDSGDNNYCFRPEDAETVQAFDDGDANLASVLFACVDQVAGHPTPGGTAQQDIGDTQFATISDVTDATANADTGLILLEGVPSIFSVDFAGMVIDDAAPTVAAPADYIGALSQSADNPFADWAFGIFDGNRSQPLWFEAAAP